MLLERSELQLMRLMPQVGYRVLFEVEGFDALVTQVDKFTG